MLIMTFNVVMSQDNDKLARNLISLRGEVEDLQSELKILKSENKNSLIYLNTRKTELQANIDRKSLKSKQAHVEHEKLIEKIKLLGADSEQLVPHVIKLILSIKKNLNTGIPFKQKERLSVVEDIERKLNARKVTSQYAINSLWAFLEDELRLTRENAIYSQTIQIDGENKLVEIVKLGTVIMYFKTRDDKYGVAKNIDGLWDYQFFEEQNKQKQIALLFDSLKKQIRQGYFSLPLSLNQ